MLIRKKRITPPNLTDAKLKQYIKDKMLFRKEQFVLEPTIDHPQGVLFGEVAEKWQLDYIYKPMDERRADGLPKYKLLYLQLIKKAGKTNLLAGEAVVQLLLTPFPTEENYIIAGDKDQAAYLLQKMKDFIARNENFVELFTVYKNEVIVESTGAMIKVLSSTAETKSGLSPDFVIADEFWVQKTRDLWDVMFLGMAAKTHAQFIVLTNAGFDKKSICFEVRNMCKEQASKSFYWFEPTGDFLHSLPMPWISEEWKEIEKVTTPSKVYARYRENLWIEEGDSPFMPVEGWDCFKPYLREKSICYEGEHFVGIDLGLKKDAAALTVLHRKGKKLEIDLYQRWLGSSEVPVRISEIEDTLILILKNFNNCVLVCDPWQMMGTIQRFRSAGIEVLEFYLTAENIGKLSRNLFYLLKNVSLDLPENKKLREELKSMQVVEKSYGWRIDHSEESSSDLTLSLGMASLVAMERGIDSYSGKDLSDLGFLDQSSIFKSSGKREYSDPGIKIEKENKDINEKPKIHTFIRRQF